MCRVLEVSPAGSYASLKRSPSWHALIDEILMARVRIIHAESNETYGAPRVHRELQAEGLPASPKRVVRLMREEGLVALPRKRPRVSTTDSNHDHPIAPNLLAREFDVNGWASTACRSPILRTSRRAKARCTWRPCLMSDRAAVSGGRCGTPSKSSWH
jgi:transposase InsO family protein